MSRFVRRFLHLLLALATLSTACRADPQTADLTEAVNELLPGLEARSGLEATGPINVERRDAESLRAFLAETIAEEFSPEELAGIEASYRAFGLFPDTLDLEQLFLDLYTEQVMGYYDPLTKTLYVMEGVSTEVLEPVLVHELVHALQDQHEDLGALMDGARGNDRQLAAQAAIEGHATVIMFEVLLEQQTGSPVDITTLPDLRSHLRPMIEAGNADFPVFRAAPRIVRETLLFPYLDGAALVQALWRERPDRPPPFGELLPLSSAQVLRPREEYLPAPEPPVELELTHPSASEWEAVYDNTLGAFEVSILLAEHLGETARRFADGWAGDHYQLLENAAGDHALVWYSLWSDRAVAGEFADAYERILRRRPDRIGAVERTEIGGRPAVRVVDVDSGTDPASVPTPDVRLLTGVER